MIQSRVRVADLREHVGRTVSVCGWVNTLRLQRKMQFVIVRDGTGMVPPCEWGAAPSPTGDGDEAAVRGCRAGAAPFRSSGGAFTVNCRGVQARNVSWGFLLGTPFREPVRAVASEPRREGMTGVRTCPVNR